VKFEAVLVRPLDDQLDRDGHKIDPAGVQITDEAIPIWREFSYNIPDDLMGSGVVSRAEDGSLIVTGELTEAGEHYVSKGDKKLAIGIVVDSGGQKLAKDAGSIVEKSTLQQIGMTWQHQDPAQPAIRLLDEL
jgi:hypothetical protein